MDYKILNAIWCLKESLNIKIAQSAFFSIKAFQIWDLVDSTMEPLMLHRVWILDRLLLNNSRNAANSIDALHCSFSKKYILHPLKAHYWPIQ